MSKNEVSDLCRRNALCMGCVLKNLSASMCVRDFVAGFRGKGGPPAQLVSASANQVDGSFRCVSMPIQHTGGVLDLFS
jgi:hypothetical protein